MNDASLTFLKTMLETPSPSGYERPVQDVVRGFVGEFADEVTTDWHGNVTAAVNPSGSPRIMLAGHCDQIGLMVKHIDKNGFLRVDPIGGWDVQMLIGQSVQIWTDDGPVSGVMARKAIHLLTPDERKTVPRMQELWIDVGVPDGEAARKLVCVGDPVTLRLGFQALQDDLAVAPGMDDKVGAWVVLKALEHVHKGSPNAAVFAVSTVQEEIGLRGAQTSAFSIEPQLGIAVDVTHATDCPTVSEEEHGEVKIGKGPVVYRGPNVNPAVYQRLIDLAERYDIPVQSAGISKPAGNDANAMQISRGGVATGIVAIPNRYMHSPVEVISLSDLENAARLIGEFCLSLDETSDFTP